jgi:predicted permease
MVRRAMHTVLNDIRFAIRSYARTPGFTAVAVLTLALGTGVNATVFTFVDALLFRPAPVPDPSSLVSIYTSDFSSGPYGETSYPDFRSMQDASTTFSALAAHDGGASALLRTRESVERIRRVAVSAEFFPILRVSPRSGRLIGSEDFSEGAAPVAVVSEQLWRRTLGGAVDVLQQHVSIDGVSYAVVGVLSRGFVLDLGRPVDAWIPLPPTVARAQRDDRNLRVLGRIEDRRTIPEAQAELTALSAGLARDFPDTNLGTLQQADQPRQMLVVPHTRLPAAFRREVATLGGILMGGVALVLLIACANVANLLLSRAAGRAREMAVRRALGAGRGRIVAQLLTESVLLGLCGGGGGVLLAMWTADALPSFFPPQQAAMLDARLDAAGLAFTMALALASGILFGMAPAMQSARPAPADALRASRGATAGRSGAIRSMLVVAQVALATVLLVSAALLVRSLFNALGADFGFATRDAVVLSIEQPGDRPDAQGLAYAQAVVERVGALPGVTSASLARSIPFFPAGRRGFRPEGYVFRPGETREFHINVVSAGYFDTMRIPVLQGRPFDSRDLPGGLPAAIVNEVVAARYYGGRAVGRRITDSRGHVLTIVGVVGTTKNLTVQEEPLPLVYYALAQQYDARLTLIARTGSRAVALVEPVRRAAADTDRSVAIDGATTLDARIAEALTTERLAAALIACCGMLALLLAIVGVYGVVAFAVARRAREFGVRLALGARPAQILALVLRQASRLTAAGVAVGLAAGLAATRVLGSVLYGVSPSDTWTFAGVALTLTAVTVAATVLPASRALRVDPVVVLRDE